MKAICYKKQNVVELNEVKIPQNAKKEHLIIKMQAIAINPGDFMVITGLFKSDSQYEICGVSGVGKVVEIGEDVPTEYKWKNVVVYRALQVTDDTIGTWSEYSQLHYLNSVILPDNVNITEYSGSLVNSITPYAFLKQIEKEGHSGIIATAGTSATGRAMLGICLAYDIPLISIVRNAEGKKQLEELNAKIILIESDPDFETQLEELSKKLNTTAVFDGVGGELISKIALRIPRNSTIYCYGFLGGNKPLSIHTSNLLMKGLTVKGFGNFQTETVHDVDKLTTALKDLTKIIDMPHFKTKNGKTFKLNEFNKALKYKSEKGEKAILLP